VAGKPMMEWVIDNLAPIASIEKVFVVTNHKFAADFRKWADHYNEIHAKLAFEIVDDGSTSDADKLGALGDLHFVIQKYGIDRSDLLVVAGDNLFSEVRRLRHFASRSSSRCSGSTMSVLAEAKKYGVVAVEGSGVVTQFVEKPANPPSTLIGIALYFYPAATVCLVAEYIAAETIDQPGRFVQWLYRKLLCGRGVPGTCGSRRSKETLDEANRIFARFVKG
jgi:glucose-1-phosphate thymidylyltransferase